ncbi:MAG: hypothetical protein JNK82_17970 [Myxococcaceae bacterium]|nr:hypothetical protein [Myxococcaceae bacterium]
MGAELKRVTTSGGVEVLRVEADGLFDEAATSKVVTGILSSALPVLMVLGGDVKISPGARKALRGLEGNHRNVPVALVARSGIMRAMISMIIKGVSVAKKHPVVSATFSEEGPALAWLDVEGHRIAA